MKQVLQDMSNGKTSIVEAPIPSLSQSSLLIKSSVSLISAGTERSLIDFGKASFFDKAKQQPEKVRMVLTKIKTDGFFVTLDAVRSKLAQPMPLGYSNVGVVIRVGDGVEGFKAGDRVVSNGPHADMLRCSQNLCAKIPDEVSDEAAAFVVIASIGLQGIRLAAPTMGEAFVVTGAGLIGLLTVQLLRSHGCRVLAIDFDEKRLELARSFGAEVCNPSAGEDPVSRANLFSRGRGVDAVLITASTKSNDPISHAARMCRKRGRIILVGVTGMRLNRADFYEKELSFQVSCSYGPGRYDPSYEVDGQDYPYGYVRWTEQRNFEAILDLLASKKLVVDQLITHRFPFEEAEEAYGVLSQDRSALGILLRYDSPLKEREITSVELSQKVSPSTSSPIVGFIGAGNYATRMLIPAFKANGAYLHTIAAAGGLSSVIYGRRADFLSATSDNRDIFNHSAINTVAIVTRHDSHASLVLRAMESGKNVFVEKPLAINAAELDQIEKAWQLTRTLRKKLQIMVGFNRRFAPQIQKMKSLLDAVKEPKSVIITVNAGAVPIEHWTQNSAIGGGRIIGEACHFIDLSRFLLGGEIVGITARRIKEDAKSRQLEDKATIVLEFSDGSMASIHYLANGSPSFPKERIEVFTAGRVLQLNNFRKMRGYGWPGFRKMNLWRQDKGQKQCVSAFLKAVEEGRPSPIPIQEIFEVARATIQASEQLRRQ